MKNEIGRKLTSLTLMTIMFAGGMTFAIPGVLPAANASHTANLFVSAENSQFSNYFAGPMVIEAVVIDPDISDTDQGKGEPDVDVNSKDLRMVQTTDGNWYGYFADRLQAQTADQTLVDTGSPGNEGLDFGVFCDNDSSILNDAGSNSVIVLSSTVGFSLPISEVNGAVNGTTTIEGATCTGANTGNRTLNNVVREFKIPNPGPTTAGVFTGQIGINSTTGLDGLAGTSDYWPFIQLYNFNPTGQVNVVYNRGGGVQTTTLNFDTVDQFADLEIDRDVYPRSAQVHVTMTDLQLNIDPTDEDSWTFGTNVTNIGGTGATNTFGLFYQVFDENGRVANDTATNPNIRDTRPLLMFEDNGLLALDPNADSGINDVVNLFDNDNQVLIEGVNASQARTTVIFADVGGLPVTMTELGSNQGILSNYDEADNANIRLTSNADRGRSAVLQFNNDKTSIVQGFRSGKVTLEVEDGLWNSGEEIPVILIDNDENLNSRQDEDLDVFNPNVFNVPSLATDNPFTIDNNNAFDDNNPTVNKQDVLFVSINPVFTSTGPLGAKSSLVGVFNGATNTSATIDVLEFSGRALLGPNRTTYSTGSLIIDLQTTMEKLLETIHDPRVNTDGTFISPTIERFHGFNLLNIDLRGINVTALAGKTVNVYLLNASAGTEIITGGIIQGGADTGQVNADAVTAISLVNSTLSKSLSNLNDTSTLATADANKANKLASTNALFSVAKTDQIGFLFNYTVISDQTNLAKKPVVADFFSFGFTNEGIKDNERISNQIVRFELEETGDNTSTFAGTAEFRMVNQVTILDPKTYEYTTIDDEPEFILIEDETDEDSPRISYRDRGTEGTLLRQGDQAGAPTHSGVVSFNAATYKIASPVTMTIDDTDLNADVDLIDIYTPVNPTAFPADPARDLVGKEGLPTFSFGPLGKILDVTFNDQQWSTTSERTSGAGNKNCSPNPAGGAPGLFGAGTTMIETGPATGLFTANFKIPAQFCPDGGTVASPALPVTTTGLDLEVNYLDFRDASGQIIEVGDSAGVRANTGSISLDRTVYPVPFGEPKDFVTTTVTTPNTRSVFPVHQTGMDTTAGLQTGEFIPRGNVQIHVRVNDPDFNVSPGGENQIRTNTTKATTQDGKVGVVKISVIRGSNTVTLGYAGGPASLPGPIGVGNFNGTGVRQFGPMIETSPTSAVFEADIIVEYTDGPESATCPATETFNTIDGSGDTTVTGRFSTAPTTGTNYCILQGDILQVVYTDPTDASGDINTVTDSAAFDLRNGVLQSDKSVYIIGSDMIMTLIEPDFDLDNDSAETYDLDIIEWDSDAATVTMGNLGGATNAKNFDPEPSDFRETGDSTGIFQIVIEIPQELVQSGAVDRLERGEEAILEYTDWGPSGSDFVGDEDEDINLTIFTSNFGATVELDQKVYTWTDKIYITIIAPDHNFDSDLVDEIGKTSLDPIKVATRGKKLNQYKLAETGTDTGIFTGEVVLTGFCHDADGKQDTGAKAGDICIQGSDTNPRTTPATAGGPTDGFLESSDDDGITVSFEFSEDETVVGSSLVRWNIGETQWLEASYPASGTGVVRIIDPDLNLDPEAVDNFSVDVWSDSDAGGIDLTVTETNEATGIFEGTVFFTTTDESAGHRLRVSEGDTVTAEYEDNTLPDPYTRADELDITGTSLIGTIVPPLERAPASNARVVDAFGNSLTSVSIDQQVQITADLANGQAREQSFAYLVQVQDANGVTVSLAWITGSLAPGQSFSPALSWTPEASGTYTATVFVWESIDNPTALSPPTSVDIPVS